MIYREPRTPAKLGRVKRPRLSPSGVLFSGEDGGCRGSKLLLQGMLQCLQKGAADRHEHVKTHTLTQEEVKD
jgi:hypothetical protein